MKKQADLPNIVLVVCDTARWDRFGCYGYDRPTSPTLDALASEGMRVSTMIANAPWTPPSHASLFTGLYPSQHGCQWGEQIRLRDSVPVTLAEHLKGLGYTTICATNNGLISDKTRLARGFDRYAFRLDLEQGIRRKARRARKALAGGDSGGKVINSWIDRELADVEGPFFLFVNYLECHWGYVPPGRLVRKVGGPRFRPGEGLHYRLRLADRVGPWEAIARSDERRRAIYSTLYDGEVANVDGHLGRLMGSLQRRGHVGDENAVVMVTSDHGEHIGEHGLADHHASLDDLATRVPFVAWGPGIVRSGVRDGLWELVDVFPSITSLLGSDSPPEHLRGRRNDLFSETPAIRLDDTAFSEWACWSPTELDRLKRRNPSFDFDPLVGDLLSARGDRYKLVRRGGSDEALYDLQEDPAEETNIIAEAPAEAAALRAKLDAAIAEWSSWQPDENPFTEDEEREVERQLAALGYI